MSDDKYDKMNHADYLSRRREESRADARESQRVDAENRRESRDSRKQEQAHKYQQERELDRERRAKEERQRTEIMDTARTKEEIQLLHKLNKENRHLDTQQLALETIIRQNEHFFNESLARNKDKRDLRHSVFEKIVDLKIYNKKAVLDSYLRREEFEHNERVKAQIALDIEILRKKSGLSGGDMTQDEADELFKGFEAEEERMKNSSY